MNSSEILKAKELPPGYHNHGGTANPHPANKPHRPGTQQEKWHLEHGLTNTWYEQHGTTREAYLKEHGEPEVKPRKRPERKPKEPKETESKEAHDPEKVKAVTGGTVGWRANSNLAESHPELTKKAKETKELMERLESEGEPYEVILEKCMDNMGEKLRSDVKDMLAGQPKEMQKKFVHSIMDAIGNDPIGKAVLGRMFVSNPKSAGNTNAFFRMQSMEMGLYEKNIFSEENQTNWPKKVKDPVRDETTDWFWAFPECNTVSVFAHEYGHCISTCTSVLAYKCRAFDFSERNQMYDLLGRDIGKDLRIDISDRGTDRHSEELTIIDDEAYWKNDYERQSDAIEKAYNELKRHPEYTVERKRYKVFVREYADVLVVRKNPKEFYDRNIKDKDMAEYVLNNTAIPSKYKYRRSVDRVKECEKVYGKLFGKDTVVPTDIYTEYGTYAGAMYCSWKDDTRKAKVSNKRAEERIAEAYWDVCQRGDDANTMSKILVAHMYYEQEQIINGYGKSFEEYLNEEVGIDRNTKRIIKNDKNYTILKHQAFIMSVSRQFDAKIRKSSDDIPRNTIYVWDTVSGINILTIYPDDEDNPTEWNIDTCYAYRFWNFDKWGNSWHSLEDAIEAVRRHKRNVEIKVGYLGEY